VKSANYEEFQMYAKPPVMTARSLLSVVAIACTLYAGNVAAKDRVVTIELHVKADGLDLSQAADARTFYTRSEKALAGAIGSIKVPLLTQIYLATHTPQQAAMYGIHVPVQIAAK
jgi:hypothetical protein